MRCKFCSKSIPLLRRLSDALFCSDAHRHAYGDEQKLAFERLMTTQAVGKTQRMPAYNQVAEIPSKRPPTQTMVAAGGFQTYYLDAPLPFGNHVPVAEPIAASLTVFFCEHPVVFPARFRQSSRLARVPMKPGRGSVKAFADSGLASGCRPGLPRASTRPIRWEYQAPVADTDPALITSLWPVELSPQGGGVWAVRPELPWLAEAVHVVPNHTAKLSARQLRAVRTVFRIAQPLNALPGKAVGWPLELQSGWALIAAYPSGKELRTIAEALPVALDPTPAEEVNALFEAFAGQPLATSRHLPALAAAVMRSGQSGEVSLLPLAPARSPLPAHSGELAGIAALPKADQTLAPRTLEPAAPARTAVVHAASALPITGVGPMTPRRKSGATALELSRIGGLQALRAVGAAGIPVAAMQPVAFLPSWIPAIPSPGIQAGLRLPLAGVTVYAANVKPARTAALGWVPETVPPALAATVPTLSSKHRLPVQAKGNVMAVGRPAAKQLGPARSNPEPIASVYPPPAPVLRIAPLQGGHAAGRTRCFPVVPPKARGGAWAPSTPEWLAAPEILRSRKTMRAAAGCALQRPSNELYRIPHAQPIPNIGESAPMSLPMSEWGSKPLMRPANLRASDGTGFEEPPIGGWRSMLRERFDILGSLPSFGRLRRLPPDIKWIAMAVPLIIGIWVVARPEGKASSAPIQVSGGVPQVEVEPAPAPPMAEDVPVAAVEPDPPGLKKQKEIRPAPPNTAEPTRWDILQAKIADRAAVDIVEDFRSGLSRWDGSGNWARTWSYDRSGTVRPGNMAIFEPTTGLRNYSFEMKAAVDKRVIQWLVRATDLSNYHINRLVITPDAAQTKLELQRWTVHKGRAGRVKLIPLPHGPANQTLFGIRVDVQGDSVTTYLGDQVVDTFSDSRMASGGIGLAGAPGDQARIYAVRISHQTDFLGKLCSFLAPQPMNMQGTD